MLKFMFTILLCIQLTQCLHKSELSSMYKEVWLVLESWTIESTFSNIEYETTCSMIAHQKLYLAYKHVPETSECHLVTVDRRNVTHAEVKEETYKLNVDAFFIKDNLEIHEFMGFDFITNEKFRYTLPYQNFELPSTEIYDSFNDGESRNFKFVFKGRFWDCDDYQRQNKPCRSWNISNPSDYKVHPAPTDPDVYNQWDGAMVEINGKIMFTGGRLNGNHPNAGRNVVVFLDDDGVYRKSDVDMPVNKTSHGMVAISNTKVFIFGGKGYGQKSLIYDDADGSYVEKDTIPREDVFAFARPAMKVNLKGKFQH